MPNHEKCRAKTTKGEPCRGVPIRGSEWCPAHHPEYADARNRGSKKGGRLAGRGRPLLRQASALKEKLIELGDSVLEGEVEETTAATAGRLYRFALQAITTELEVKERLELEPRLEDLEERL